MAKSSIHIESGHAGYLSHNDRSTPTKNSIFTDEKNEIFNTAKEGFKIYRNELKKRSAAYTERTGQKLQKKAITHLSAIVNLNPHHTMRDLKKISDYLEGELGTRVFQIAIHRDEGHVDRHGQPHKNYHAHIEFMGLDEEGYSVRKKLTKAMLRQMQSDVSELLGMERGANYAKERKPRPKRLDTYEYKKAMQIKEAAEDQIVKRSARLIHEQIEMKNAKIADLTKANNELRAQLKQLGAGRAQYAELESMIRDLRSQIKKKDLTISSMQEQLAEVESRLKAQIESLKSQNEALKEKNRDLVDQIAKTPQIANLEHLPEEKKSEIIEKAEEAVKMEIVADQLRQFAGKAYISNKTLKLQKEDLFVQIDLFEETPPTANKADYDLIDAAYPDLRDQYSKISFGAHIIASTLLENFEKIIEKSKSFLDKFQEICQSKADREIEEFENDTDQGYDHSNDRDQHIGLYR